MIRHTIHHTILRPWGNSLYVIIDESDEEVKELFKHDKNFADCFTLGNCEATTCSTDLGEVVIRFGQVPSPSVIAHEAFHAAYHVLSHCGIELCAKTEEVYGYQVDDITRIIHELL